MFGPRPVVAYAEEHDLPCVDLLPALMRVTVAQPLFRDANHFTPAGHRALAEALLLPVRDALVR